MEKVKIKTMPLTNAEKQKNKEEKLRESGLTQVRLWVKPNNKTLLKALEKPMREREVVNVIFEGEEWWVSL